uniref:RNase H type-1 domain-containing protein n=1 Tax=Lotus japonicus TaxID=34305 RepID=I3SQW4_LOTJA|nr:unknown [Lotus japonicus]
MSERDEKNGSGSSSSGGKKKGGGLSTFLKVACAAAAAATVAGGLYALLKQPEPEPEPDNAAHILEGGGLLLERQNKEKGVLKVHALLKESEHEPEPYKAAHIFEGGGLLLERQNKEKGVLKVLWTKPKMGWIKLNVDGSLRSESAGCGGVLRDSFGKWISGFAVKFAHPGGGHCPHKPEEEALCRGLQWAWERGENRVEVESDRKGLVDSVKSGSTTSDLVICEIRDLLYNRDWEATLNWIPGDANRVADELADIARGLPSFQLKVYDTPPDSCRHHLMADAQ